MITLPSVAAAVELLPLTVQQVMAKNVPLFEAKHLGGTCVNVGLRAEKK